MAGWSLRHSTCQRFLRGDDEMIVFRSLVPSVAMLLLLVVACPALPESISARHAASPTALTQLANSATHDSVHGSGGGDGADGS